MPGLNTTLLLLLLGLAIAIQIARHSSFRWTFLSGSLMSIAVYAAHVVIGIVLFFMLADARPEGIGALAVALVGWLALGCLDLIRIAPRNAEPPRILMRPGIADIICLIVIAIGVALAWRT